MDRNPSLWMAASKDIKNTEMSWKCGTGRKCGKIRSSQTTGRETNDLENIEHKKKEMNNNKVQWLHGGFNAGKSNGTLS